MSTYTITLAYTDKPPPDFSGQPAHMAALKAAGKRMLAPQFFGHVNIRMISSDGNQMTVGFAPQSDPDGKFIKEDRPDAKPLEPLSSSINPASWIFSRIVTPSKGEVYRNPNPEEMLPDAYLSLTVSKEEFRRAERYIADIAEYPTSWDPLNSNCVLFSLNAFLAAGINLLPFAGKQSTRMSDGVLTIIANAADQLGPSVNGVHKGMIAGRPMQVCFRNPALLKTMIDKLSIPHKALPQNSFEKADCQPS